LMHPRGGLPYYRTAGNTEGNVSDDIMTVYWEAPSKPGETLATFYLRDCLDQQAKISKTIEVVPRDEEVIFEISNDCGDQTHFVRFNDQKESVSFRLYTFEEVLEITRQNASSPITEDYRIDIARSLHNTYLSITDNAMNKDILKNIPTLSENCYKKIISGELNIMYHGTYTNHETGETLFFEDGKMERVIKEGEEQELRGAGNPFGGVRLDDVN